jgi:hypothetical protein
MLRLKKNELTPIINELKQKLKADGQILATNAYYETCGRLTYDDENGVFLYFNTVGNNRYVDSGDEMSLEEVLNILQFEAQLVLDKDKVKSNKSLKKKAAAAFLDNSH